VAERTVRHDDVVAEDPLERGADADERRARRLVPRIGLELDPVGAKVPEGVAQLEELRLAVRAGSLERAPDPGPADLEPSMLGHDREEAGAPDRSPRGQVDRRERQLGPGCRIGEGRLEPGAEPLAVGRPGDRPGPDRGIQPDRGEIVEVTRGERLQAHAPAGQDDGPDPGRRCGVEGGLHGPRSYRAGALAAHPSPVATAEVRAS
jgi:hypothetical protein